MDTRRHIGAALAIAGLVLAACGAYSPLGADGGGDKTGSGSIVLRFATIDGTSSPLAPGIGAFVEALETASNGAFQVEITHAYGDGAPDSESRLVEAIAAGDLDGGWPATRAFTRAGIPGLDAIEAPMTITNYEALKALTSGPVGATVLAALGDSGVAGLALVVGDLRRPFFTEGFVRHPDQWSGMTFRSYNSPIQSASIEALGATPIDLSFGWDEMISRGELNGIETGIATYAGNGFTTQAPFVTANHVLWPKVFVISLSQKRLDALTDEQRGWVDSAVAAATNASSNADYDESDWVSTLCESGVGFTLASAEELDALRSAVQPVIDQLAGSETDRALLEDVLELAAEYPDVDVPTIPAGCTEAAADPEIDVPETVSSLPDGRYRAEIRLADLEAEGVDNGPGWTGTWTLTVEEGTYVFTCRAIESPGKDCGNNTYDGPLEAGDLLGHDDLVFFDFDEELMAHLTGCQLPASGEPGHCNSDETYWARWTLDGGRLTFTDAGGPLPHHLTLVQWLKID